jgi:hypothetical protein
MKQTGAIRDHSFFLKCRRPSPGGGIFFLLFIPSGMAVRQKTDLPTLSHPVRDATSTCTGRFYRD